MNKVLIITYYWPPSGGSGVQRWLKFVKYLPSYGWEPHVFTPENPSFAIRDHSLEKDVPPEAEVIRFPIWEPYDIFHKVSGWFGPRRQGPPTAPVPFESRTLFQRISTWVRGNFFIPDPRKFWVKPSVEFLSDYISRNGIHIIITTGPPHSLHLIGLKLKSKDRTLRWLADFRDPWTQWGVWDSLMVSRIARNMHKRLERRVLAGADEILTITPFYARQFERLSQRPVRMLTNGFDEADFHRISYKKTEKFIIRHVGIVNEKCDPRPFMNALKKKIAQDASFASDLQIEFIGQVHPEFMRYVSNDAVLEKVTAFKGSVPHDELIDQYGSSSLLLLILTGYKDAEGFLPGKLFEYAATGLPVLGVGPVEGDAGQLMRETGAGVMIDSADEKGIIRAVDDIYHRWQEHPAPEPNHKAVQRFSRRHLTGQLADILSQR